ncbi:MAG TPA: hypothetical protein VNV85_03250 [Puia sp.]|jgi:hypothetical protein|nr:hypothetical protein [Puia sp.]
MKSTFLAVLFAIAGFGAFAQSLEKAENLFKSKKLLDARAEIDKVVTVEKNQKSAEAWYYKCKIYSSIAEDSVLKAQVPDAHAQAFEALKKYVEMDEQTVKEKEKQQLLLKLDGYKPINTIYAGYFQDGASSYNTGKYDEALRDFKGALDAREYMFSKGWITQKFDTISTLYAGIAAEKAKKRDDASNYYSKIADAKLADIKYIDIYKWLANYYSQDKSDEADALKYVKLGKEVYPADTTWNDIALSIYDNELDEYRKKGNKDSLFAKYEQITAALPNSHVFVYNYGVELYNYAIDTSSGKRPANSDALVAKAKEKLNKSLQIKPDYSQASLLLGTIAFNDAVDLKATTKNIKGQKPEDIKKRADIRAAASKKFDEAIPYFEKVEQVLGPQGKLKQDDKKTLKDAYDSLITIYEQKNLKDKVDAYTKKFNDVDKVH